MLLLRRETQQGKMEGRKAEVARGFVSAILRPIFET